MDFHSFRRQIPPSQSDQLLREWGYDLVNEYFTIAQSITASENVVIELATGTGRMSAVLSLLFPHVITGDISLADRTKALQRIPHEHLHRVHFLQLDMEHLPFQSDRIAVHVCLNTLHEVLHPRRCLSELIRTGHPEGVIIVGDFNETGFDVMQKIHETVYHNNHERGTISSDDIGSMLSDAYHNIQTLSTPLNRTYVATNKSDVQF